MTEPMDVAGPSRARRPTPRWLVAVVASLAAVFIVVLFFVLGRHLPWFDDSADVGTTSTPTANTSGMSLMTSIMTWPMSGATRWSRLTLRRST